LRQIKSGALRAHRIGRLVRISDEDAEHFLNNKLDMPGAPMRTSEGARVRRLGSRSIELRREHIHSAVHAAIAAGIELEKFTSLATLVEPETVRAINPA
jgi:hypothetical protein